MGRKRLSEELGEGKNMTEHFQLQAKCLTQNRCYWNPKPSRGLPNRPGPPGSPPGPPFWAHLTASLALDPPCPSVTPAAHQSEMPLISSLTLLHATLPPSVSAAKAHGSSPPLHGSALGATQPAPATSQPCTPVLLEEAAQLQCENAESQAWRQGEAWWPVRAPQAPGF